MSASSFEVSTALHEALKQLDDLSLPELLTEADNEIEYNTTHNSTTNPDVQPPVRIPLLPLEIEIFRECIRNVLKSAANSDSRSSCSASVTDTFNERIKNDILPTQLTQEIALEIKRRELESTHATFQIEDAPSSNSSSSPEAQASSISSAPLSIETLKDLGFFCQYCKKILDDPLDIGNKYVVCRKCAEALEEIGSHPVTNAPVDVEQSTPLTVLSQRINDYLRLHPESRTLVLP